MNKLKKELIDNVIGRELITFDGIDNYWVIIVNNKLFAPSHGTCFFDTKEKAWKCWYQQTHYRIKWSYKKDIAKQNGIKDVWTYKGYYPLNDREVWEAFKACLNEEYGLKIIQWKYAKGNVCSESRD